MVFCSRSVERVGSMALDTPSQEDSTSVVIRLGLFIHYLDFQDNISAYGYTRRIKSYLPSKFRINEAYMRRMVCESAKNLQYTLPASALTWMV